jgi:hypothetical protein
MKNPRMALVFLLLFFGCVVHERAAVVRPASSCAGGVWVEGHYGPHGAWHEGHWRCPGVIEVVE